MAKTRKTRTSKKPYRKPEEPDPVQDQPSSEDENYDSQTSVDMDANSNSDSYESSEEDVQTPQLQNGEVVKKEKETIAWRDSAIVPAITRLARQSDITQLNEGAKLSIRQIYQNQLENILRNTLLFTQNAKRKRLFIKDVEEALNMMGQSVVFSPDQVLKICPSFVRKEKKAKNSGKFHKGTVAKRQAKKIQKNSGYLFVPRENFKRYCKAYVHRINDTITFQDKSLDLVQLAVEDFITRICVGARRIVDNRKQISVKSKDILLSYDFYEKRAFVDNSE